MKGEETKKRILDAALTIVRTKGLTATSLDDLCRAAGVTKGGFFHHFASKDAVAVAAAEAFSAMADELFANAPYHKPRDPLKRVLCYVDFRIMILRGALPDVTCLLGTMVQEAYATSPEIRDACQRGIWGHANTLVADITEAKRQHAPNARWSPQSLALHTQAVIQGAFIMAKASGSTDVAVDSLTHLRRYIELLHSKTKPRRGETS